MIREISGWGYNSPMPLRSKWKNLPGPAWFWQDATLTKLDAVLPHFETVVAVMPYLHTILLGKYSDATMVKKFDVPYEVVQDLLSSIA